MDNNLDLLTILVADRQRALYDSAESSRRPKGVQRPSLLQRLVHRARRPSVKRTGWSDQRVRWHKVV